MQTSINNTFRVKSVTFKRCLRNERKGCNLEHRMTVKINDVMPCLCIGIQFYYDIQNYDNAVLKLLVHFIQMSSINWNIVMSYLIAFVV